LIAGAARRSLSDLLAGEHGRSAASRARPGRATTDESRGAAVRELVYFVACTVDGFIAREDGSYDFFPMTGAHLPYLVAEYPETLPAPARAALGVEGENRHFDAVVMGRRTYEVGAPVGLTNPYPQLRQYVVSATLPASPDPGVALVRSDPVGAVRRLKAEAGRDIWLCGGGDLAAALYDEIDQLVLKVNPVVLRRGIPLFGKPPAAPPAPRRLELLEHQTFDGGVAIHRYRVAR
jgi:dihydrofolate reductase